MKKLLFSICLFFICNSIYSQAGNNTCATSTDLGTVNGNCTSIAGDLYLANQTNPNPTGSCSGGLRYDVWYKFTVPAASTFITITVNLTSATTTLTTANTSVELFNTSTCVLNSNTLGCGTISSSRTFAVTAGTTYCFRVYTSVNPNASPANWGFNVCVTSNDNCTTATNITPGTTNMDGSVFGASASAGVPVGCATGTPDDDVWYSFIAPYSYATITLSNAGTSLATSGARLQLFSYTGPGPCPTGLTSFACGSYNIANATANIINATGLTPGNTYYIRVYSSGAGQAGFTAANSGFRISVTPSTPVIVGSGRMNEVYNQQILTAPQVLADPWEVTYGPDNYLWITESKGYRVYRMNPTTGVRDTVLDISLGSTFLPVPDQTFNMQFNIATNNPQGGLAGLAIHPKFLDPITPENYVYISYVRTFDSVSIIGPNYGTFYTNRLVRFTYNTGTGKLESPVSLCDTLPGSNDHNSQRIKIAPVAAGGSNYLFYAQGDMGAGQFSNQYRVNKAQNQNSYEGKILRFNLISDGDAGLAAWIPNDNPYSSTSAVWCIGIRNNQGFAYDSTLNILYGSSHGPYSDDELNIIQQAKNYGHPLVIGFQADNNYNGSSAGASNTVSSCPLIVNESGNAATIGASYKDPLFSAYAPSTAVVNNIWVTNPSNQGWPSEAWSGLDIYTHTLVPGWKNSLVAASLKWGRLVRLRLNAAGTATAPTNTVADTISYFGSRNRFRDLSFAPNGKDMYVIMDRSASTSGPSANNPVVPSCPGCVQKYTFLGYADAAGVSTIPTSIDVTNGTNNACNTGTTVTIDDTNRTLWVPITGPDGNIMAEIKANLNVLGTVTSSFYKNAGPIRIKNGRHYLDRNILITPQFQPTSNVDIRLYISKAEYDSLKADVSSGIIVLSDLKIQKNNDPCSSTVLAATITVPTTGTAHGANGYVLQGTINSFSSFYFANGLITLPLDLLTFTGSLQSNNTTLLKWKTEHEFNTLRFVVERSIDGINYYNIGAVTARGTTSDVQTYSFYDNTAANQQALLLFYRLKIVDVNGEFKYSNVITITLADLTGSVTVMPNPVTNETRLMVTAPEDGRITYKIFDNSGRVILQKSLQVRKGNVNTVSIDMSRFTAGMYFLNVSGSGVNSNIKLQKE